jgi:hypothetical protein
VPVPPETHYAESGDVSIAYQVVGDGPFDIVVVPGFVSHVELGWGVPFHGELRRRLVSFARLIVFDKRGTGMSDPVAGHRHSRAGWTTCGWSWTPPPHRARLLSGSRRVLP